MLLIIDRSAFFQDNNWTTCKAGINYLYSLSK
jgi:hypothetical protein